MDLSDEGTPTVTIADPPKDVAPRSFVGAALTLGAVGGFALGLIVPPAVGHSFATQVVVLDDSKGRVAKLDVTHVGRYCAADSGFGDEPVVLRSDGTAGTSSHWRLSTATTSDRQPDRAWFSASCANPDVAMAANAAPRRADATNQPGAPDR